MSGSPLSFPWALGAGRYAGIGGVVQPTAYSELNSDFADYTFGDIILKQSVRRLQYDLRLKVRPGYFLEPTASVVVGGPSVGSLSGVYFTPDNPEGPTWSWPRLPQAEVFEGGEGIGGELVHRKQLTSPITVVGETGQSYEGSATWNTHALYRSAGATILNSTLQYAVRQHFFSKLAALPAATTAQKYAYSSVTFSEGPYVRNTSLWTGAIDLSFWVFYSGGGGGAGLSLIGPNHAVAAAHTMIGNNGDYSPPYPPVICVAPDNTLTYCYLVRWRTPGPKDACLVTLSGSPTGITPIPASLATVKLCPPNVYNFAPSSALVGLPGISLLNNSKLVVAAFQEQGIARGSNTFGLAKLASDSDSALFRSWSLPTENDGVNPATGLVWWGFTGDSGSPHLVLLPDDSLMLSHVSWNSGGGSNFGNIFPETEASMATDYAEGKAVSSEKILVADLSAYPAWVGLGQTMLLDAYTRRYSMAATYQWQKNGSNLVGQTSHLLTVTGTARGTDTYSCVVSDSGGAGNHTITYTVITQ